MIVRDAAHADLRQIAASVTGQPLLERYGTRSGPLERQLAAALDAGQGVLVAEEDGALLGLAWFLPSGTFAAGGYLRLIALNPGEEGHGVGAALLDEVERRVARESRSLFLLVSHWNEGARRFYARRGYLEVGSIPRFVRDDTDEVICYKRLA
jgi:GNAT superfamily N-acetyltransferase